MYTLASRNSSAESNVDELENKAGSMNAVLSGTTTSNGLALLNGAVSFGSTISGLDLADVNSLQGALDTKAPLASPTFSGTVQGITQSMVGLGKVDNTADKDKLISTLTQSALDNKAPLASPTFSGTVNGITKTMVGLGNVDNTSDLNKPIANTTQYALNLKAPLASPTFSGTVNDITESMVGLGNVDNTSGSNNPISSATQGALNTLNGKIPDLFHGRMKFYDDDTGTGRGVTSHPTALHFALTQSINPSTSIIMTMSQNTSVVVNEISLHKTCTIRPKLMMA